MFSVQSALDQPTTQHNEPVKNSDKKKLIMVNAALWIVAMLLRPIAQILPTGSGNPPKILELLIPLFFLMLAGASTYLLNQAAGKTEG